ncbi:HNH endonuclease [Citrobacter tructae]|uniref:HNH endonuclease n=1 Tax=Citrobacter tructae TaxID=2562449 RepID=A0ABX5T382_9ENTR|nr:HNH endonuclease signature motif containing protein [Citrobacter tructae]QBX79982.1 HNH endonuclease [Citrobacter tructae]
MSEEINNKNFKRNYDALRRAATEKYPNFFATGVDSKVETWLNFWAEHDDFSPADAQDRVCDLEDIYQQRFSDKEKNEIPLYPPLDSSEIKNRREIMNDSVRAVRQRKLQLGHRLPGMDANEEEILQTALERIRREREESDSEYAMNKENRHTTKKTHLSENEAPVLTDEQQWLIGLEENTKQNYFQWCSKNNLLCVRKNWSLYQAALAQNSPGCQNNNVETPAGTNSQLTSQQDTDHNREFLASVGWSPEEIDSIDDSQAAKVYAEELDRQVLNSPHFNNSGPKYSRVEVRPAQGRFRAEVLRNWGDACAITGQKLVVEACHIIAHAEGGASTIENGIALAVDLHRLLDAGHLLIVDETVLMSDEARCEKRYADLHNKKLRTPRKAIMYRS